LSETGEAERIAAPTTVAPIKANLRMVSSVRRPDEDSNDSADEALIMIKLEHCSGVALTQINVLVAIW
jgi:hypothetical protein